jgi:Uncharacterized conserved protein
MRKPIFLVLFFVSLPFYSFAQHQGDSALMMSKDFITHGFDTRNVTYGFKEHLHTLNPFYHIFSSAMYVYQSVISQELMRSCAFEPSCSKYSKELIKTYGLTKGVLLTSDRITRCSRVALSGKEDLRFDANKGKIIENTDRYSLRNSKPLDTKDTNTINTDRSSTVFSARFAKEDFEFANYLIGNDMKEDALVLIEQNSGYLSNQSTQDSVNYIKGWTYYSNKKLSEASSLFMQVSNTSEFYPKSVFFGSISLMHQGSLAASAKILSSFKDSASYLEVYSFERAGLALLQRNFKSYDYYSTAFTSEDYTLSEQEATLTKIAKDLKGYSPKSLWLAGAMSCALPGLGKVYAGRLGEGISSFLFVGSLGVIAAENWVKNGIGNWKTLLFGLTGLTFYIGNIYGSITTAKIANDDFNKKTDIALLYSIHIPLRSIFE